MRRTNPTPQTGVKTIYSLALTADERRAFDCVGARYNSGKVADFLMDCIPEDREWGDDADITSMIPEHIAFEIKRLAQEEDHAWDCFAPALAAKLNYPCWSVV